MHLVRTCQGVRVLSSQAWSSQPLLVRIFIIPRTVFLFLLEADLLGETEAWGDWISRPNELLLTILALLNAFLLFSLPPCLPLTNFRVAPLLFQAYAG